MAAFRWIQMSSLLILMLQFKGTTEQHSPAYTVTAGHDVTLHCKNLIQGQRNCTNTTWLFSKSRNTETLFELGKKNKDNPKSGRLSLSVSCSLVLKKVKVQDAGTYTCRRYINSQDYEDSGIQLSVINNTTKKTKTTTTTLTAKKSTTRTLSTTQSATPTIKINTWTTEGKSSADWRWLIIASVGLAAFLITVVVIIRWKKTKQKTQRGNNTGQTREPINKLPLEGRSLNPADTQCDAGTSQDTAEGDDGVPYASITFTKKTKNKAQARGADDDDDDDDTVTYSTVKASSSYADPSDLYSTINKANKCS